MATKTIHLEHAFAGDFILVYESIADFRKFGELHPYMVEVRQLSETIRNGIEYRVKEELLLLGFLKIHPQYNAEVIEITKNKHIQYVSNVKGGMVLVIDFTFFYDENRREVRVSEHITITGNRLLIAYFATVLQKAHVQLFDKLATRLTIPTS
ncbi:SRPBCC family protein [Runella slithyformis]|uniref:Uncharacterized protein n=1 Tax=Runella slithyformis (strain ATCC 29530 / DSM 19594 / LMG 11500 / NCIMB 11436 / LSU 4) TaxID=761193 RepID=A0A7U3ZQV1_RUNSL|nr:SRPBCC family protein [Runella slithyformis]AEI51638.1 hypothetical protein Runsl_5345 [Runella slithyformis DSM 19594]